MSTFRRFAPFLLFLLVNGGVGLAAEFDPFALRIGSSRADVFEALKRSGIEAMSIGDELVLVEEPFTNEVYEEQVGILVFDEMGALRSIHVRFLPESGAEGRDLVRLYEDLKQRLLERMGRPSWERVEGATVDLFSLSEGRAVRAIQWDAEPTVRLGIPRRVDGEVAVEIVITGRRIARADEFWGSPDY